VLTKLSEALIAGKSDICTATDVVVSKVEPINTSLRLKPRLGKPDEIVKTLNR
jgi:hypothetical protein